MEEVRGKMNIKILKWMFEEERGKGERGNPKNQLTQVDLEGSITAA